MERKQKQLSRDVLLKGYSKNFFTQKNNWAEPLFIKV